MKAPLNRSAAKPRPLRDAALLGLGAAAWVAALRAGMSLLGRGFHNEGFELALVVRFARHMAEGLGTAMVFFLGLILAGIALRRRANGIRLAGLVAAFYAFFSWAFISLRLPVELLIRPGLMSNQGMLANGAAALAGLVIVSTVVLGLFMPRAAAQPVTWLRRSGLGLLVVMFLVLAPGRLASNDDSRPNVILISIDTLRPDHLGSYGYGRDTSPNLDRFASQALRYENAFSNHPWTLTAHATMMTGMLPTAHGVSRSEGLDPRVPTVAGLMSDAGYQTFAIVDRNDWLHDRFGYARGFKRYHRVTTEGEPKVNEILASIDDARSMGDQPFFAFGHFYDVHSDWTDLPYESDYGDREQYAGWYEGDFTGCDAEGDCASALLLAMNSRNERLTEEDLRYVKDLYDAGITTLDRKLAVLFEGLEARGLFENTVVIVTADHGEEFGEHGTMLHGNHFDECLSIPLLIRSPSGPRGEVTDELVSLEDLASTILDFGGVDYKSFDTLQGRSLAPMVDSTKPSLEPGHPVLTDSGSGVFGLRTLDYSLVGAKGVWSIFDVHADPGQLVDMVEAGSLGSEESQALRNLRSARRTATEQLGERYSQRPAVEIPRDAADALAKLGYADGEDEQ